MIRRLVTLIIPLLLPALVYLGWLTLERRRGTDWGKRWDGRLVTLPWEWLVLAGVALAALTLFLTVLLRSPPPIHAPYIPAHVVDGRVIEGETAPTVPPAPPPQPPSLP
ncbi:MAG: DUF6111 family protein [Azospirillaceae bacterium]|nr:DUF6111 family protein [Azospirillaceae bacterium]